MDERTILISLIKKYEDRKQEGLDNIVPLDDQIDHLDTLDSITEDLYELLRNYDMRIK